MRRQAAGSAMRIMAAPAPGTASSAAAASAAHTCPSPDSSHPCGGPLRCGPRSMKKRKHLEVMHVQAHEAPRRTSPRCSLDSWIILRLQGCDGTSRTLQAFCQSLQYTRASGVHGEHSIFCSVLTVVASHPHTPHSLRVVYVNVFILGAREERTRAKSKMRCRPCSPARSSAVNLSHP